MALITDLPIQVTAIDDSASIILERDLSKPLRILGVDFKREIGLGIQEPLEHAYIDLVGSFRPSQTKGEFYSYGKTLLQGLGYNLSVNKKSAGLPVMLEIDSVSDNEKGWMYHWVFGGLNYIKVAFSSGTTKSFKEGDTTAQVISLYSYAGLFPNTGSWLRDIDFPGYPVKPTSMWNPSDLRNGLVPKFGESIVASLFDQSGTDPMAQTDPNKRPSLFGLPSNEQTIIFGAGSTNLKVTPFSLSSSAKWTIVLWVRPSDREEVLLGSSTGHSRLTFKPSANELTLKFSNQSVERIPVYVFDKEFHMVSLTGNGEGKIDIYVDNSFVRRISPSLNLSNLDSVGMGDFSGLLGAFYLEQGIHASELEIKTLYSRMLGRYYVDEEWNEAMAYDFSAVDSYGFSEEDEYGFVL